MWIEFKGSDRYSCSKIKNAANREIKNEWGFVTPTLANIEVMWETENIGLLYLDFTEQNLPAMLTSLKQEVVETTTFHSWSHWRLSNH